MWIVYQTTCLVNLRRYIGVHNGTNPNYLGSGKALKAAIKKYGEHNFIREILFKFKTEEEAYKKEAELVDIILANDRSYYNLITGGLLGSKRRKFSEETKKKMSANRKGKKKSFRTQEHKDKIRANMKGNKNCVGRKHSKETIEKIRNSNLGKQRSDETKKRISESQKGKTVSKEAREKISKALKGAKHPMYGKKHTEEARRNMSEAQRGRIPWNKGMTFNQQTRQGE